jgi:Flp pilus assembly protein CpaB
MNRTRFILVFLLLVVVIAAVVTFFVLNQNGTVPQIDGEGTQQPPREVTQDVDLPPPPTEIPVIPVVVAIQDIPRGVTVAPNMVEAIEFPVEYLPEGTFEFVGEVVGTVARVDISRGQFVLSRQIVIPPEGRAFTLPDAAAQLSRVGSDAAAVLEEGRVAISLPIDAITSVAYALAPGDSVDVLVSMLFVDVDIEFQSQLPTLIRFVSLVPDPETGTLTLGFGQPGAGLLDTRNVQSTVSGSLSGLTESGSISSSISLTNSILLEPSEPQRPRLLTQRTVQNAQVIWVGLFPDDGIMFRAAPTPTPIVTVDPNATEESNPDAPPTNTPLPPRPQVITLGVRPQDAVVLTYMAEAGMPMTFALRSARATSLPPTDPVTLDYIMGAFGDFQPPDRFNFAVEPAIRSIRELSLGNRISLSPQDTTQPQP